VRQEADFDYIRGALLPDAALTLLDYDDSVLPLATGYTFTLRVYAQTDYAFTDDLFTKTGGLNGADTAPNLTIVWATAGELSTLAAGMYVIQLDVVSASKPRKYQMSLLVRPGGV
jgi:hypothetical protein